MTQHELDVEYAGFWPRLGATILDSILMCLVTLPLVTAVYGMAYWNDESFVTGPADLVISYVLPAIIIVALWVRLSTTPGKMAIAATIVDADTGGKPGIGQFVIRYIGYFISALPLGLGYIWAGFDPRKQSWHDKMAGTVVIRRRAGSADPVRFDAADAKPSA